jgi:hypothetical protein
MAENIQTHAPTGPRNETTPRAAELSHDRNESDRKRRKERSPWAEVPGWIRERPWPVLLFTGLFVLAVMAWTADSCVGECPRAGWSLFVDYALPVATLAWIALLFAWFVDCFTADPFEKRTKAIEFAYFFMVLSFCLVAIMIADMGKARKFGVVEGCVENLSRGNVMPIQCDYPMDMWSDANRALKDKKGDRGSEPTRAEAPTNAAGTGTAEGAAGGAAPPGPDSPPRSTPQAPNFDARRDAYRENHNYHFLLNIGGRLDRLDPPPVEKPAVCKTCPQAVYSVRGGLPVPVYFIVLALIGGAISLAKNVPGIQKRSDGGWQDTPAEPKLAPGEVRELLLFQVLQFVTAPMLAVIAYHTIKPESSGSTVALGFVVGFGSDQILQLIRSMVKSTQGAAPATPLAMSIQGKVVRGDVPVSAAKVTVEGRTKEARTDAQGEFALTGLPLRPEGYVIAIAAGGQTQVRRVKADEPKTVDLGAIDMVQAPPPAAHAA